MIVLDLETSGSHMDRCGIWQIGAIDLESGEEFLEEARIDNEDEIQLGALNIVGKTEEDLRNPEKQSQKEMLEKFFKWTQDKKIKNIIAQCPQFVDFPGLLLKARKYGLELPLHYRVFDLHTLAQAVYYKENGKFSIEGNHSDMGLSKIMEYCGLKDKRVAVNSKTGKVVKKGAPHNALEDAKLEADCFKVLLEKLRRSRDD